MRNSQRIFYITTWFDSMAEKDIYENRVRRLIYMQNETM